MTTTPSFPGSMEVAVMVARQTSHKLQHCLQRILQTVTLANFLQLSAMVAVAVGGGVAIETICSNRRHWYAMPTYSKRRGVFMTTSDDKKDDTESTSEDEGEVSVEDNASKQEPALSSAMIATIGVYKNFISPLLPPACRFVPTCSQYGVQAIQEFGPTKGVILTSWRLLRCSPFGGKGYDPPKWPPVPYTYSSY